MIEIYECEVCGHKGEDVAWAENQNKSGYFCMDISACFLRYIKLRNQEQFSSSGKEQDENH